MGPDDSRVALSQRLKFLVFTGHVYETAEQKLPVLRTGRGFGVVLERDRLFADQPQSGVGAISLQGGTKL